MALQVSQPLPAAVPDVRLAANGGLAPIADGAPRRERQIADESRTFLADFTADERRLIAQVKRLIERYRADPGFRIRLNDSPNPRDVVAPYGIEIEPREVLPLLEDDSAPCPPHSQQARSLLSLWQAYKFELERLRDRFLKAGECGDINPRFDAWRHRQIRRIKSELGGAGFGMVHPILAFELSVGCSVGCWFCGVSAGRLRDVFRYTRDNARLWRGVLTEAATIFGAAAQTGFCYWATDPADNPDYPQFIDDYRQITGALPATTTAAPLKDREGFTHRLLQLHDAHGWVPNRFSILNLRELDRVHAAFTAEELLGTELVLQNREAAIPKALAGRARDRAARFPNRPAVSDVIDGATIACVSGFLTNMIERRVQLVSPTRPSDRWPLGYRVYGERSFTTASEFRSAIEALIARHMPATVGGAARLGLREDLVYRPVPDGFVIESRGSRVALTGFDGAGLLGDMLCAGDRSAGQIEAALASAGLDIVVAADLLQQMFESGLLEAAR